MVSISNCARKVTSSVAVIFGDICVCGSPKNRICRIYSSLNAGNWNL